VIAERRSIHDRPEEVEKRQEAGHWEGDLLICKRTRPVLVLKERMTRFALAARLAGKSAAETLAVLIAVFRRLDPRLRSSITFDNDTAFARHTLLASACAMATWFRDAYVSWQKGAVENANGRLRRDLPRDLDLDALGDAELQEIILTHNHAQEVPRLPDPAPGAAQGAWQGRADPLRLTRCASFRNPPCPWTCCIRM
jgi:IS30 family transposase